MRLIASGVIVAGVMQAQVPFIPIPTWLLGLLGGNAKEVTQLLNHAQLGLSYARQAQQLAQEVQLVADSAKNLKKITSPSFSDVMADIDRLDALVQAGQGLGYSVGDIETRFLQTYKGWGGLPSGYAHRKEWLQVALDTSRGVLKMVNAQSNQRANTTGILNILRGHTGSPEGQLHALQAVGELADVQVGQLQRLNALLMADISSKQAYQAAVMQKEASAGNAEQLFLDVSPSTMGYQGYSVQGSWKP